LDDGSDTSNTCYIVQGDDPLEVYFESELEEDIDKPYDELASFCQKRLKKYDLLKIENEKLKKENNSLLNKNDSSKLSIISKENEFLKNQVVLISKQKETILNENGLLKKKIVLNRKEKISKKKKNFVSHAHVYSFKIENDIFIVKKKIDCLSSTLSQCTFNHNKLESMFCEKYVPYVHAHHPWRTPHVHHDHTHSYMYARVYTCTHCGRKDILQNFALID